MVEGIFVHNISGEGLSSSNIPVVLSGVRDIFRAQLTLAEYSEYQLQALFYSLLPIYAGLFIMDRT
jgi:hypothetical protein